MVARPDGKTNILGKDDLKNFGIATRKYIGASFEEHNCLQFIHSFFTAAGITVPDNYKGHNLETYMKYWEKDPENAIKDMMELFKTIGEEADIRHLKKGDIVVVQYKSSKFPSLYVGGQKVMASSIKDGVQTYILGAVYVPILARRLICHR